MQCILSKLSIETYARFSGTDLIGHHFVFFFFNFSSLCLSQQAICPQFKECKYYSFSSVLVGGIFSKVNPGIAQQATDLIPRCQIKIQLKGKQVFLHNLRSLNFLKIYTLPLLGVKP